MDHSLINTIVASIVMAFIFGMIAKRLKFSVIVGYLVAGMLIGPYTPGFVADISAARQLACLAHFFRWVLRRLWARLRCARSGMTGQAASFTAFRFRLRPPLCCCVRLNIGVR